MLDKLFRSLPPFKGKERMARVLLKNQIDTLTDVTIAGKYDCTFLLPNIKESIGFEIFINGMYEKETVDFIVKNIPLNSYLLDIGANIGAISIPVCKKRSDVKVVCIEAAPWVFEYLQKNTKQNGISAMQLLNKAVSDKDEESVKFYTPRDQYGKGSLLPAFTGDSTVVKTISVNSLVSQFSLKNRIGFIKIDVEGYEYFAFLGASELLKDDQAPDILFEYSDWAETAFAVSNGNSAQGLLFDFGYRIFLFEDGAVGKEITSPVKEGFYMFFATKKRK